MNVLTALSIVILQNELGMIDVSDFRLCLLVGREAKLDPFKSGLEAGHVVQTLIMRPSVRPCHLSLVLLAVAWSGGCIM